MLWMLISISISQRKTAPTVSLNLTWISNNPLNPSSTFPELFSFFFFKENALKKTVYVFLFLYFLCDFAHTHTILLIPQLLKFTTKKKIMGDATTKPLWHGGTRPTLSGGFWRCFPFIPAIYSLRKASRICNALIPGRGWMRTGELGEQMDGCVWCVFPATSLTAVAWCECNREGNWKWRERISIVLGLIKPVLLGLGSGHQKFIFTHQISVG